MISIGTCYNGDDLEIFLFDEGFYIKDSPDKNVVGWHAKKKNYFVANVNCHEAERYLTSALSGDTAAMASWVQEILKVDKKRQFGKYDFPSMCIINSDAAANPPVFIFSEPLDSSDVLDEEEIQFLLKEGPQAKLPLESSIYAQKQPKFGGEVKQVYDLDQNSWGVCTFVSMIQAAFCNRVDNAGKLLKGTNYETLLSVIEGFSNSSPDYRLAEYN